MDLVDPHLCREPSTHQSKGLKMLDQDLCTLVEETLKLGDKLDDMMETMVQLYAAGEVGKFWPLMEHLSPETSKGPGYAQFQEALITRRNKVMADRANPQLEQGGVFMAVGALHLPGKLGVVQLLRDAGYTVTSAL